MSCIDPSWQKRGQGERLALGRQRTDVDEIDIGRGESRDDGVVANRRELNSEEPIVTSGACQDFCVGKFAQVS